jgi:hypothetical protein
MTIYSNPTLSPLAEREERFARFAAFKRGWDSYDAPPIDPRAIAAARAFLERIGDDGVRMGVFPTPDGGIQVENMGGGPLAIEFTFRPDGAARGHFFDLDAGHDRDDIEWEEPVSPIGDSPPLSSDADTRGGR